MTWRIHAWDAASGTGAVVAPHLGPYPFGPAANVHATTDFALGEAVIVELDRAPDGDLVRTVTAQHQRQPAGTQTAALADLNRRKHGDLSIESRTDDALRLWLGDCCAWCGPSAHLTFHGVQSVHGLDDDMDLGSPWFRLATADERRAHALNVPAGAEAYGIVTQHGQGRDGPTVWVVATALTVEDIPSTR
jgi:hypothetical protein